MQQVIDGVSTCLQDLYTDKYVWTGSWAYSHIQADKLDEIVV